MASNSDGRRRVLVVDDNRAIHEDFIKILGGSSEGSSELLEAERLLLGEPAPAAERPRFEIDTALQGQEGVARVQQALKDERPYAMAFVDMRMPPGWDGLETIRASVEARSARAGRDLLRALRLRLDRGGGAPGSLRQAAGDQEAVRAHRGTAVRQCTDPQVAERAHAAPPGRTPGARRRGPHPGSGSSQQAVAPSRHPRCAHRAAEPGAAGRPPGAGDSAFGARRAPIRGRHVRPRPLQDRQRFLRTPRRRRAHQRGGASARGRGTQHRYGRPSRRR